MLLLIAIDVFRPKALSLLVIRKRVEIKYERCKYGCWMSPSGGKLNGLL